MKQWFCTAALVSVVATVAPAQAHPMKRHHTHASTPAHPDTVTQDGKDYKVCNANTQDGCIQPREAGLGFGNRPTEIYRPDKADQHP